MMVAVTVSPKFQVVIPLEIRRFAGIEAGQKLQVLAFGNRIEFLPIEQPRQMRGFLQDIASDVHRDEDSV